MNSRILFSIVIPSYNRAALIPHTLNSVLEQTYFSFEIIIVDDGSTDNTHEVIARYLVDKRVNYYRIVNSERGAARNYGVDRAKGDYVTFLDSDDVFLPRHLETAVTRIAENDYPKVVHLAYEILHPNGRVDSIPFLPSPVNVKLIEGNFLSCMGVFLQRDFFLQNRFDEDRALSGSEDYELWMRVATRTPIFTFPDVTSRLINHDERSVVNTDAQKLIVRINLLIEKVTTDALFDQSIGTDFNKFKSYQLLYLALHLALSGNRWLAFRKLLYVAYLHPGIIFNYRFIVAVKKTMLW